MVILKTLYQPVDYPLVNIVTTEVGITVSGFYLEHSVAEFEDGNIKSTTAEVIHGDALFLVLFAQAVGQRCSGRLVHDALHIQTGNPPGVLGSLALTVVEIGRYRNNRLFYLFAQIILGGLFHLLQNHRRDLLRRVLFVMRLYPHFAV